MNKTPDKIYVKISHPVSSEYTEIIGFLSRENKDDITYIRKDALLEWLEERKSHFEKIINEAKSDAWRAHNLGRLDIIFSLIKKLNSM